MKTAKVDNKGRRKGLRRRGTCLGVALLVLGAMPVEVLGQHMNIGLRALEVNVHAGLLFFEDPRLSDSTFPAVGARLAYHLPGGLGFGGSLDWERVAVDVQHFVGPPELFDNDFFTHDIVLYSAEVDYTFNTRGRIQYFVGGGFGGATIRQSAKGFLAQGIDAEPRRVTYETFFVVPLGAGLKVLNRKTDPSLALRFDARDHILWVGDSEGDRVSLIKDGPMNNIELSAGISFLFGGS